LVLAALHASSSADPGDEICFPLFLEGGALPGDSQCEIDAASNTTVGGSTYFCTANGGRYIERFCRTPLKAAGGSCPKTPKPISISSGEKTLAESDYGPLNGLLSLTRYYSSAPVTVQGRMLGGPWRSMYEARIVTPLSGSAAVARPDGRVIYFRLQGGNYVADADVKGRLTRLVQGGQPSGWRYLQSDGRLETYDAAGVLKSIEAGDGYRVDLTYSTSSTPVSVAPGPGYLIRVADSFGRGIDFKHGSGGTLVSASPAAGTTYIYTVTGNAAVNGQVLSQVQAPDGAVRAFKYAEPAFVAGTGSPQYLTGVEDENGARTANYFYDAQGLAYKEQSLASPGDVVGQYQLAYSGRAGFGAGTGTTTVTDPGGAQYTYAFTSVLNVGRMTSASQPAGSGCAASANAQHFDARGNADQVDDFNGYRTCRLFDTARNLELKRVEGLANTASCTTMLQATTLPATARRVTSEWHPLVERVVRRAEPRKLTTYVYNGQPDPFSTPANQTASCVSPATPLSDGNAPVVLCRQVEQATTDASGVLGTAALLDSAAPARMQQWTYNEHGQVLTAKDPLDHTAHYAYYTDTTADHTLGDLHTVTNAKAQITTYTRYNFAGQWLEMKDANDVITTRVFDERQRLKSVTSAGSATTYDYWPTGLLKRVTLPDASSLAYGYDDAHRLTSVTDNLGNSITYTLDASGNRTGEEIKDPSGRLAKTLTRVPDALNRIQQTTGRE